MTENKFVLKINGVTVHVTNRIRIILETDYTFLGAGKIRYDTRNSLNLFGFELDHLVKLI
jgi:hypothetical protein